MTTSPIKTESTVSDIHASFFYIWYTTLLFWFIFHMRWVSHIFTLIWCHSKSRTDPKIHWILIVFNRDKWSLCQQWLKMRFWKHSIHYLLSYWYLNIIYYALYHDKTTCGSPPQHKLHVSSMIIPRYRSENSDCSIFMNISIIINTITNYQQT